MRMIAAIMTALVLVFATACSTTMQRPPEKIQWPESDPDAPCSSSWAHPIMDGILAGIATGAGAAILGDPMEDASLGAGLMLVGAAAMISSFYGARIIGECEEFNNYHLHHQEYRGGVTRDRDNGPDMTGHDQLRRAPTQ